MDDDDGNQQPVTYETSVNVRKVGESIKSLIDGGASGGIGGKDMTLIGFYPEHKKVNVGIAGDHQVTGLRLAVFAAMMMPNKGPVIGIFHNYALCRRQNNQFTLRSNCKRPVACLDDTSKHFQGTQPFTLASGHRVPMKFSAGLPYIEIKPVTKEELENPNIEQVICSRDRNWNSRQFDDQLSHQELIERMPPPNDDNSNEDEHFILDNGDIDIYRLRNNKDTVKASDIRRTNNSATERSDEVDTKVFYDTLDWLTI